jgi:hypothetical protein
MFSTPAAGIVVLGNTITTCSCSSAGEVWEKGTEIEGVFENQSFVR